MAEQARQAGNPPRKRNYPADQPHLRARSGTPPDLSPRQRACVVLRYYRDLPVAQVAAALGVGEGTVKRYLSEAMTRLAARLSPAENG